MDPPNTKSFFYSNDQFSSIFNKRFPSLIIKIHVSHVPELPSENTEDLKEASIESAIIESDKRECEIVDEDWENIPEENIIQSSKNIKCFQNVSSESLSTSSEEKKRSAEDLENEMKKIKNQTFESLLQSSKYLSEIESAPILEEIQISHDDFENIVNLIQYETGKNQQSRSPIKDIDCVQGSLGSSSTVLGKRKGQTDKTAENGIKKIKLQSSKFFVNDAQLFQTVSNESLPFILRQKRKERSLRFKTAIKKIKRHYKPNIQVASSTIEILDNLICHILEKIDEELNTLKRIREMKTLTEKQLGNAAKLCLPKALSCGAIKYGQLALCKVRIETE